MGKSKNNNSQTYLYCAGIMAVCLFSFFVNNQIIPADIMESRNLATAQEMVEYGNYLLPTMNGEPRLEKPPLPTWIAAGIEQIAPGNLVVQRYATGFSAMLMTLFLFLVVTRLTRNRGAGLVVALVLATTVNVILMGRTATWDIYTHSFMLGALYFLIIALEEKGAQWKYFLLSGFFIGLSFLSKGPVSWYALLLPFLISYILVYRTGVIEIKWPNTGVSASPRDNQPPIAEKKWAIALMILVALVVSFWWYGYTYFFHQDFAVAIAQKESSSWLNHNVRPWYYYWQFAAEGGIWALFWITALVYFFLNKQTIYQKEYTFSFIWFAVSLVALSIIPEKKTRYLLPLLIPGAMVIGFYMYQMIAALKTKYEKVLFRINGMVIAIVLFTLPIVLYILFFRTNQVSLFLFIAATIGSWGLCAFILQALYNRNGIRAASVFFGIILTMIMIASIYLIPIGSMFINEERHSIGLLRENKDVADLPFYYNDKEGLRVEFVYESNRRILKINTDDNEAIEKALPFVLLSNEPIEQLLSGKKVIIEYLDTFDNNWKKKGNKRHNPDLVKEAAIIRAK